MKSVFEQITFSEREVQETVERSDAVQLCYLFGSYANGNPGPLSDLDIAVLLDDGCNFRLEAGRLSDELCRTLRTDRVDLVLLNEAPDHLSYRVIRDGRLLVCRDQRIKESFETSTVMRYLDFKPVREIALRDSFRPVAEAV